jgi:glycyl-tRNA synthetase beta subunit
MLSETFKDRLFNELVRTQLKQRVVEGVKVFATPRRLAVTIPEVEAVGQDRETEVDGPAIGAPAQAIAGFAKKHGVAAESLGRRKTPKGEVVMARVKIKGLLLDQILSALVTDSLKALPIPKVMRWGAGEAQFVRPVHGLVMQHGRRVVPGSVLGLEAGNVTRGHRFMGASEIALRSAEEYEERLLKDGAVIADFTKRRDEIERQLLEAAKREGGSLGEHAELLDEVTALVELPSVYVGRFDPAYLEVPQECLILTMRQNQKYFPLFDPAGKLLPKFLIVSNMKLADPRPIVGGNAWCGRGSRMRASSTTRTARSGSKRACRNSPGSFTTTSSAASSSASSASSSWPAALHAPSKPTRCSLSARLGCRKPICSPGWWASFPSCRASWVAITLCTTASRAKRPTRSRRTTSHASPAIIFRTA